MNNVHKTPIQCQWEKINNENYMYIQHGPSEITENHIYVSILHWPSITECWHRHAQMKLKPFFSMHVVICTVAIVVNIKRKITQANIQEKYMV